MKLTHPHTHTDNGFFRHKYCTAHTYTLYIFLLSHMMRANTNIASTVMSSQFTNIRTTNRRRVHVRQSTTIVDFSIVATSARIIYKPDKKCCKLYCCQYLALRRCIATERCSVCECRNSHLIHSIYISELIVYLSPFALPMMQSRKSPNKCVFEFTIMCLSLNVCVCLQLFLNGCEQCESQ